LDEQIKEDVMGGATPRMGKNRNSFRGNKPFGRPRHKWEDNIEINVTNSITAHQLD
jgi:hypothetical protein